MVDKTCASKLLCVAICLLATGCQTPVQRLHSEIARIRHETGSTDPTVRVLLVFPEKGETNHALAAMTSPETLYISTFRFVTVVVGDDKVTLKHRNRTNAYQLAPSVADYYYTYTEGDYPQLLSALLDIRFGLLTWETCLVTDLELNPIEKEERSYSIFTRPDEQYPQVIKKYGRVSRDDYDKWLRSRDEVTTRPD